jgi:hypothetical protein
MRLREFAVDDKTMNDLLEHGTGGAATAAMVASVPNAIGPVISRQPSLFGYIPQKTRKKRKSKSKSA